MDLNYFIGKYCSILTQPTTKNFNDIQHAKCFFGIVHEIDSLGVWLKYPDNKLAFFPAPIVAIIEENTKNLSDNEYQELKKELQKVNQKKTDGNFISLEDFETATKKLKKNDQN